MAKINDTTTYPNTTPALTDHVPGTDVSDVGNDANGETVTFLLSAIRTLVQENLTAATITGGTVTADTPVIDATQTWNNAGVTFDAIRLDVTNTASALVSTIMHLKVGGSTKFRILKDGTILGLDFDSRFVPVSNGWQVGGSASRMYIGGSNSAYGIALGSGASLGWASSANPSGISSDLYLSRDAANTLAQKSGTNAQTFNIYNTYTDASNYERGALRWSANLLEIGSFAAGTGTLRGINFGVSGNSIGFYGATPVAQPSATGETVGFTAGTGTGVNDDSTFTGNVGSTAYRLSDIVKHLKNLGILAS